MGNILVVAPHADDEAYGCGGVIARLSKRNTVRVVVGSIGTYSTESTRTSELAVSLAALGVQEMEILSTGYENRLDIVPQLDMVTKLDKILDEKWWDVVFYPYPSHHADHRAIEKACVSALRPGAHKQPGLILMYEYFYPAWGNYPSTGHVFEDITSTIDAKLEAVSAYASQLKELPHPGSVENVKRLAAVRGASVDVEYAEMFYLVKGVGVL